MPPIHSSVGPFKQERAHPTNLPVLQMGYFTTKMTPMIQIVNFPPLLIIGKLLGQVWGNLPPA